MKSHHQHQGFNPVNLRLSFQKIKEFTDALSPAALIGDLAKKKKMADKALEHLDSYFAGRVRDGMPPARCGGGKPRLP